tara:strand:+ start:334 stop:690 length:357 start_codon:yes stop_codon:yes gene_type:complete
MNLADFWYEKGVPADISEAQARWERRAEITRAYNNQIPIDELMEIYGETYGGILTFVGIVKHQAKLRIKSPIEKWMEELPPNRLKRASVATILASMSSLSPVQGTHRAHPRRSPLMLD